MELKEFTKTDWYGLAGAERGPNGELPLVAYNAGNFVVVDRNGIYVQFNDGDVYYNLATTFAAGKLLAERLPEELTHEYLTTLGFQRGI